METTEQNPSKSKGKKILQFVTNSAPFALLLSIILFGVEYYKNDKEFDKTINSLQKIEMSLSTKHIGIFPNYLEEINNLLDETISSSDTSTIIIFEDVLFYGAFYNGEAFKDMIKKLTVLSGPSKRRKIVIAYYGLHDEDTSRISDKWTKGRMFREVVQGSWVQQEDYAKLKAERSLEIGSLRSKDSLQNTNRRRSDLYYVIRADSIVSEKYFAVYRDDKQGDFLERRKNILKPLYDAAQNDYNIFDKIDKIKSNYIGKPENTITFNDIYTMYSQTTKELIAFFKYHNIELIPLSDYLSMYCWSNGKKVLFVLPGRFAADEIGFISHDEAILKYIKVTYNGIKNIAD